MMSVKNQSLIQPFDRFTTVVTNALAWGMALRFWLMPKSSSAAETTEATTAAPPVISPTPYPRISRPVTADDPLIHSFDERFSRRYFGIYHG